MSLYAGIGQSDITPEMGVELAGFGYYLNRTCDSVRDPLHARTLYLARDTARQLIISCELLGLSKSVVQKVLSFAENEGIPRENVLIVSVHTHTGPCVKYHAGTGETDEAYLASLPDRICASIRKALSDTAPVTDLSYIKTQVPGDFIYNRADPQQGPVDPLLRGFVIRRENQKPVAVMNAACHGVFLGRVRQVSADFSGEILKNLSEMGYEGIYLNGLCGDIDPFRPSESRMLEYAGQVTDAFLKSLPESRALPCTLSGGRLHTELRLMPVTKEDIRKAADQAAARSPEGAARVAQLWKEEMLLHFDLLKDRETCGTAWCLLGGIPILALPFEGFTQIGLSIRRALHCEEALILGCAEEIRGYLPTKDDFTRGAYAALESTFLYRRLPYVPGEAERVSKVLSEQMAPILSVHS